MHFAFMRPALSRVLVLCLGGLILVGCGGSSSAPPATSTSTPFVVTNLYLPNAVQGVPYATDLQTNLGSTGVTATAPITFQLQGGNLPPGLSLSSTGSIEGNPQQPGFFEFSVIAVDSSSTPQVTASKTVVLEVQPPAVQLSSVGQNSLSNSGENASVVVHGDYAFVGTRGVPGECPATGIRIVSLKNPSSPQVVATIPAPAGESWARLRVRTVSSTAFSGDLLAVAASDCNAVSYTNNTSGSGSLNGVYLYDVSNPAQPQPVASWTGSANPVHDVAIVPSGASDAGVTILAATPNYAAPSPLPATLTPPDFNQIGDLTVLTLNAGDTLTSSGIWGLSYFRIETAKQQDPTGFLWTGMGQDQREFLDTIHIIPPSLVANTGTTTPDTTAALGYWDGGIVLVDVPELLTYAKDLASGSANITNNTDAYPVTQQLVYAAALSTLNTSGTVVSAEGNTHEVLPVANGLVTTEKVCVAPAVSGTTYPTSSSVCGPDAGITPLNSSYGWGLAHTFALQANNATYQTGLRGTIYTPDSQASTEPLANGYYSANQLAWNGNSSAPHVYIGWYSDGVIDADVTNLGAPSILGAFVPPATADPLGGNPAVPLVDGVGAYSQNGNNYLVVSDMNSGLWVVQELPAPSLTISTSALPAANNNVAYSAQLQAVGGVPPYSWAIASGSLPLGITIAANGALSGTPLVSAAGSGTITVQVTDTLGNKASVNLNLTVNDSLGFVNPAALPVATLNESYSQTLQALNGTGTVSYAVTAGSLPQGVTLDSTGVLSGTPNTAGTYNFSVTATDSATTPDTATQSFSLKVAPLALPSTLPNGGVGVSYMQSGVDLTPSWGAAPFTFATTSGSLPTGLNLSTAGLLSGIPTAAGTFTFTIQVTDNDGQTASQTYTITISPLAITSPATLTATVGTGFYEQLTAVNGQGTLTWSATGLPSWLTLDASKGILSGTPTSSDVGTGSFTLTVTDSATPTANTGTQTVNFTVNAS